MTLDDWLRDNVVATDLVPEGAIVFLRPAKWWVESEGDRVAINWTPPEVVGKIVNIGTPEDA